MCSTDFACKIRVHLRSKCTMYINNLLYLYTNCYIIIILNRLTNDKIIQLRIGKGIRLSMEDGLAKNVITAAARLA